MPPSNDRGRPVTIRTPSKMSLTDSIANSTPNSDATRCRCCGRVLTAESSVRVELGPVCRLLTADVPAVA